MGREEIACQIKKARLSAGLTQAEVANSLGITYQAISNYERGVSRIDSDTLKKLCDMLEISISDVLEGDSHELLNINIATRIKNLRFQAGISQRQLADELGVTQALLAHYENNLRSPSLDVLCRIATRFNVSVDYLLGQDDGVHPKLLTSSEELATHVSELLEQKKELTNDDLKVALFGGDEDITDDMLEDVKRYAGYIKQYRKMTVQEMERLYPKDKRIVVTDSDGKMHWE